MIPQNPIATRVISRKLFTVNKDMSSPSSSMIPNVLGVALPVDASLNESLGLDSVQSQVTANFGPSAASDG